MTTSVDDDGGSTLPLILGFFLIAFLVTAGSVAAGDAFVQQRDLQDVCDGAATAAAADAADLSHARTAGVGDQLQFADVQQAVNTYLGRDASRHAVQVVAALSADAHTLTLTCTERTSIAFGAMFGKADGVEHTAVSSARAPVLD